MQGPVGTEQDIQGGSDPAAKPAEDYLFKDVIPKLGPKGNQDAYPALLPHLGGQPGYDYYQCPVTKQRQAQQEGWKPVRDTSVYAIEGPLGRLDLVLLCQGSRIAGAGTTNNKRVLYLDPDIAEITGLDPKTGMPKVAPTPKESKSVK